MDKKVIGPKALVVLTPPEGFLGDAKDKPNVDVWYLDGAAYEIAYGQPVAVPLALAQAMKDKGAILGYTEVK